MFHFSFSPQENRRHRCPTEAFQNRQVQNSIYSAHFHVIVITVGSSGLCVFIQENNSTAVTDQTCAKPSKTTNPDDLVYSSVTHSRPRKSRELEMKMRLSMPASSTTETREHDRGGRMSEWKHCFCRVRCTSPSLASIVLKM